MARARLRLLALARNDMIQLRRYGLREFGPDAADRLNDDLERVFALLRDNPHAGAEFSKSIPGTRVFSKRGHRILYRLEPGAVVIQRILHHSRDVARHLEP